MIIRRSFWLAAILLLVIGNNSAKAQFEFEKIKPRFAFQPERVTTFYSNSRYNRIEGLYLNLGVRVQPRKAPSWQFFADAGYGFKNEKGKRWRYNIGLQKELISPNLFTVGFRYFNDLYTLDRWVINMTENSVAALFSHSDFMDYVGRKGWRLFLDYKWKQLHTLRAEWLRYEYEPLSVAPNTEWSLFARKKRFPNNPHPAPVYVFMPGSETALRLMAAFDFRDNPIFPLIGWYFEGIFEKTTGDFSTTGLFLTLKRFQPTFGNQRLKAKLLFGTRSGSFAYQHLMTLGGIGNLRGYDNKEFIGNRLLYGTLQYNFGGDILQRIPLEFIPLWETMTLGVFVDAGYAWFADATDAGTGLFRLGDFELRDIRADYGISLIFTEGLLRLDIARRADRSGAAWQVYFRILDKF